MAQICSGDHAAYATLVRRHIDPLYNYAYRLCRSAGEAEDLVQDTLLAVWQKPHQFNPARAKLSTWLHRIAHNRFIDGRRKQRPLLDNDAAQQLHIDDPVQGSAESDLNAKKLDSMLEQLPLNQRAALLLTHAQGFSNREVAGILGQSVRATESLLARARKSLRQAWRSEQAETSRHD